MACRTSGGLFVKEVEEPGTPTTSWSQSMHNITRGRVDQFIRPETGGVGVGTYRGKGRVYNDPRTEEPLKTGRCVSSVNPKVGPST